MHSTAASGMDNGKSTTPILEKWYYPPDLENDLQHVDLPRRVKEEIFACAWEYSRSVIPQYTNWPRYVAFMRIIVIGVIAEFRGALVKVEAGDKILGYDLEAVLDTLFDGTAARDAMAREYRTFLLIAAEKSSNTSSELFRRYANALVASPKQWFRMRDCDALARFTIAAALACNDADDTWFSDEQLEVLTELCDCMYDAVAFFKHRAEGEISSTFAYVPSASRVAVYAECRQLLWALDVAWRGDAARLHVINFARMFGGPIHMMMRRYRFVEEDLTIGKREDAVTVNQARRNWKLWYRVEAAGAETAKVVGSQGGTVSGAARFEQLLARDDLMFTGLADFLRASDKGACARCYYPPSYGAARLHEFGGARLCSICTTAFHVHVASLAQRLAWVFPELRDVLEDPARR
ncbi:hypothetical protein CERZMDRAFT_47699 [Cercospora zeae-maydis SCOH1-5]|uniref:ABA 3 protein n=1 Tax=Cercospora zeae-maydis SCOH1-5 TaxID=717836 RepID=A0A6A6F8F9_9PEZI|nr:hypothetical protein CERZMDRAFT_47699 [Cercospora zeae-maydis SCOH1-5]